MKKIMCFILLCVFVLAGSVFAWTYKSGDAMISSYGNGFGVPPTTNPSGPFSFVNGAGTLLIASGGVPWSGQPGWAQSGSSGEYGLFWCQGWAGWPLGAKVVGHGPSRVQFQVPAFENGGSNGVVVDANMLQLWEDARRMRMLIDGTQITQVTATNTWAEGSMSLFADPGDVIEITLDGGGAGGNGTSTFAGWNVKITEATIVPRTLTVATNPAYVTTVLPSVGAHVYEDGRVVALKANPYYGDCPTSVKVFDHWVGDVNDINAATTFVTMDADKTVTAVYVDGGTCPPLSWDVRLDWDTTSNPFTTGQAPAWSLIDPATDLPYPRYGNGGYGGMVWGPATPSHLGLAGTNWGACEPVGTHIMGHTPWTVRWISPVNGWVTIYAEIAQLWDVTRRQGIEITKNGEFLGEAVCKSAGPNQTICLYNDTNPSSGCTNGDAWGTIELTRLVQVDDVIDFAGTGNYPNSTGVGTFASAQITIATTDAPETVDLTVNVLTSPDAATDPGNESIIPGVGTFPIPTGETVNLSADRFVQCPEVLEFAEWIGDVANTQSADTTIFMNQNKTVTVVYADARACPDECHIITNTDLDGNCMTDIADLAIFAQGWLVDNRLSDDGLPY